MKVAVHDFDFVRDEDLGMILHLLDVVVLDNFVENVDLVVTDYFYGSIRLPTF